jgi:hypothetical protein
MRRFRVCGIIALAPALACLVFAAGCGGSSDTKGPGAKTTDTGAGTGGKADTGKKAPLDVKYTAAVAGRVVFDGDPPKPQDLKPRMQDAIKNATGEQKKEAEHCLKGDTQDPMWQVGSDKGVANVLVFLRAPAGKYFKITDEVKKPAEMEVVIDQPYCLFKPHVVALYPSYYDGKKQEKTGQKFKILNSAPIAHNTEWHGNRQLNAGENKILRAKSKEGKPEELPIDAKPCRDRDVGGEDLINIKCDIHKWMTGKAAVFDHPFFAVTKEDGTFEIKHAPAGEVVVAYWHETFGDSLAQAKTMPKTLKDGDNKLDDIKVK